MATSTIKKSFELHTRAVAVPRNSTVMLRDLPKAYILSTSPTNSDTRMVAIGCGYGHTAVRHSIVKIVEGNFDLVPDDEQYGLKITNKDQNNNTTVYIMSLQF